MVLWKELGQVSFCFLVEKINIMKNYKLYENWMAGLLKIVDDPQLYELLKSCPLEVVRCWYFESISYNSIVCHQGDICQKFSIIVTGEVDVFCDSEDGRCYKLARYSKGDVLGELEIFGSRHYICSVRAVGYVQLLSLSQESFNYWLTVDNHFNQKMLRFFSEKYYVLSEKACVDNLYSLHERVCMVLWKYYQQQGENQIVINKQELAQLFATTTRSINRILFLLKENNIIDVSGEEVILLNPEKLKTEFYY